MVIYREVVRVLQRELSESYIMLNRIHLSRVKSLWEHGKILQRYVLECVLS